MVWIILFLLFTLKSNPILASDRNIFGLHLTQASDVTKVNGIINSSGGNWGWVTLVIRSDQLDTQLWQDFFNNCRKYHLIPILRLASTMDGNNWKRPDISEIDTITNFLNSLVWPTKTRHIILFNEINHASEWGGEVDVKGFADLAIYTIDKLKSTSSDFYVLSSALDLASPEKPPQYKSAENVYREIFLYRPEYFTKIDALASHSYPNHGYVGTPKDTGQHSILGYRWELEYLKKIGITKPLPVFITETGWPHREGETPNNYYYTAKTASAFLATALEKWQLDKNIIAITPFIFNYPHPPFDHFSWLDTNENIYPEYQTIIDLAKGQNNPEQTVTIETISTKIPLVILTNTDYSGLITLKNTGQSIWGESVFCLRPESSPNVIIDAICLQNQLVDPGATHTFDFKFRIDSNVNQVDQTYLGWNSTPRYKISPFADNAAIYHPNTNLFVGIINHINLWLRFSGR